MAWFESLSNRLIKERKMFFVLLGNSPPRDRTNQTVVFEHIDLTVFISIASFCGFGLVLSISLFGFNIHFRSHR